MIRKVNIVRALAGFACVTSVGGQQYQCKKKEGVATTASAAPKVILTTVTDGKNLEGRDSDSKESQINSASSILDVQIQSKVTAAQRAFDQLQKAIKEEDKQFSENTNQGRPGRLSINRAPLEQLMIKKDNIAELLELITPDDIVRGTFDGDEIKEKLPTFVKVEGQLKFLIYC